MVFGIVQRHGGEIDLQTQPGHGTNFRLCFPKRKASDFKPVEDVAQALPPGALRILLVEDEPQVREVLTAFLEIDGHRVRAARDGAEGLVRFGEETFDLVITDKAMPGLSGPQLAEHIRQLSPKIPIILLSGFNSPGNSERVDTVNVVAAKPITMPALRNAVRKAMEIA
jgi:CheY-like chemotaxis protein